MPWKETAPLLARPQCMAADLSHVYAMTERCERCGMRRHTGDTWVRRDPEPGLAGLQAQRLAPHRGPHRLSAAVEAVLWAATRAHRHSGPRHILPSLARRRPDVALPASSTAGERCQREGFSQARTRRCGSRPPGALPLQAEAPNAVWTADVTGQVRPGDGLYGDPLTGAEADSRLLCSGSARLSTPPVEARPIVARRFQADGLPDAMRPDHGPPCATPACCGLSPLSGWWITLGIRPQRLEPGRPEPHGAHARLPRPRTAEATRPPEHHPAAPHARFDRCCREDTEARPPEALHDRAPAARSRPSPRALPAELPAPT